MRITNQMITGNSLRSMQKTMTDVDAANKQLISGKKIQKPSEDPVVAMRALKLRSTVSQLTQYKEKNIKDADSWMDLTESSLTNIVSRLQDVYYYCEQGASDTFDTANRSSIISQLQGIKDIIYSEGSTTYAGRYIFSGYRTSTNLIFDTEASRSNVSYDIEETLTGDDITVATVIKNGLNEANLEDAITGGATYTPATQTDVYRLKLAYGNLDSTGFTLNIDGTDYAVTTMATSQASEYYDVADGEIHYIPETGELIFGSGVYGVVKDAENITVNYQKTQFEINELRPEHYFNCTKYETDADGNRLTEVDATGATVYVNTVEYTQSQEGQKIKYEVNFNQSMTVNTEGRDAITHAMGNAIDDLEQALQDVVDIETVISKLEAKLADPLYASSDATVEKINELLEDAETELALKRTKMQSLFAKGMTTFQNFMTDVTAFQSDMGTRLEKLELIATRVDEQYANFEELKSVNEDVEEEEAIINMNQAKLVYDAALAATASILQKTLLDYL